MDLVNVINEARRARDADLVRYMARILGRRQPQKDPTQGDVETKQEVVAVKVPTVQLEAALRLLSVYSSNITLTISADTMVVAARDMSVHIQCARV